MGKKPQENGPYKHYERPTTSRTQMHADQSKKNKKGGHARIWAGVIIIAIVLIAIVPILGAKLHGNEDQNIAEKSIETSQSSKSTSKKSIKKSKKSSTVTQTSSSSTSVAQSSSVQSQASSSSSEANKFKADSNGTYTVQAGDTLSEIARANNTTVADLMKLNGISKENNVTVGQTLRVKAAKSTSSSTDFQN